MKSSWLLPVMLFLAALGLHLAGLGSLPLFDRDEPRFSEASREMLERNDYIVPKFNDQERFDKPPLFYWCQTASYRLFGQTDFAARFPSALAAALTAVLIFLFGKRLYGMKGGAIAATAFTLCAQTLLLAKAAVVDMTLALFTTLGLWAGWELLDGGKRRWWWVFYTALGLGFLTKGPVGFLPLAAVLLFAVRSKQPLPVLGFKLITGLILTSLIIAVWALPAVQLTEGRYFQIGIGKHVLGRSLHAMQNHGGRGFLNALITLPFYLATYFVSFFPWCLFTVPSIAFLRNKVNRGEEERYLISAVFITFIVFTLARTKLPHYTYPAFPAMCLLFARTVLGGKISLNKITRWAIVMCLLSLVSAGFVFPYAKNFFPVRQLAEQSRPWLKPEMEFASVDFNEPSIVWYFRKYVRGWQLSLKPADLAPFMEKPGPRLCVLPAQLFGQVFPHPDPSWKRWDARGFNPAKGRWVDLTMVIKSGG